ncbi:hypothetical protein DXG01_003433 [Tephrocybe rancida]|nr:hypothetical protein DXG01_003433 [Tephrocybe rancida]
MRERIHHGLDYIRADIHRHSRLDTAALPLVDRNPGRDGTETILCLPYASTRVSSTRLPSPAPSLSAPSPSVTAFPAPPEEPVLRRSAHGCSNAPKEPYASRPIKPLKRKPKDTQQVKSEATAAAVPRPIQHPEFIDSTLENSDNEVQDMNITFPNLSMFAVGDIEVSYPIVGSTKLYTWQPKFHVSIYTLLLTLHILTFLVRPQLHSDLTWFYDLDLAVQESSTRQPPIAQLNVHKYSSATPNELMKLISKNVCMVVFGEDHKDTGFSEQTLSNICNLNEVTTLHDYAVNKGAL